MSVGHVEVRAVVRIVCHSSPVYEAGVAYRTSVIMQVWLPGVQLTRLHLPCAQDCAQGHSPRDLHASLAVDIYCVLLGGFLKFPELNFPTCKMGVVFYLVGKL